jgi:plastocyanin
MHRRLLMAITAAATVAVPLAGVAAAGAAAPKKNELRIVGDFVFKPNQFVKDTQRFAPGNLTVKSGATVTLRNQSKTMDPHTISFVKKKFLPKSFDDPAAGPITAAHGANGDGPPTAIKVDNGVAAADQNAPLQVDTMGDDKTAGDSQFIAPGQKKITFKMTAAKGSRLYYYCIIHFWMQGRITVN